MFQKLKKFYAFTTKPKIDDFMSDGRGWIKQNRGVL